MAKKSTGKQFIFLFRGGADPAKLSPQEIEKMMGSWQSWMGALKKSGNLQRGEPLGDDGKLLSGQKGKTVSPFVESEESIGGFLLVSAKSLSEAAKIAKGCPIFDRGGSVEVRPVMEM